MKRSISAAALILLSLATLQAAPQQKPVEYQPGAVAAQPFVVEYYYKARWGYAEEFIELFKKNHLPLLRKQIELGRIRSVSMVTPRYHTTEEGRWDYRVTIVFKNAAAANDDFDESALARQLYPDQTTYKREEQRRFEILEAHWDLPIKPYEPGK